MKPNAPSPDREPTSSDEVTVPLLLRGFSVVHGALALLFTAMALLLLAIAAKEAWMALHLDWNDEAAQLVIEAMGVLAAAVVALQIAQTITEEEVIRTAHISAPTRVRRFLSRFMVVIVVAIVVVSLFTASVAVSPAPRIVGPNSTKSSAWSSRPPLGKGFDPPRGIVNPNDHSFSALRSSCACTFLAIGSSR